MNRQRAAKLTDDVLNGKADIEARVEGWTPLCAAIKFNRGHGAPSLIHKGADVEAYSYGFTPLIWAACEGQVATTKALIAAKCNVNARSTPPHGKIGRLT